MPHITPKHWEQRVSLLPISIQLSFKNPGYFLLEDFTVITATTKGTIQPSMVKIIPKILPKIVPKIVLKTHSSGN